MVNPSKSAEELDVDVRRCVYDSFLTTGESIAVASISKQLGESRSAIAASLSRLAKAHMLVLQPESGEVLMAIPFSAVPTAFRVQSERLGWWANCIWDAMGVCAMTQVDGTILTSCPDCGEAMSLTIQGSQQKPAQGIVHFAVPAAHWWDDVVYT